jgi:hypothetical protein
MVRNYGSEPEWNIPVRCWIDSAGTRIYNYQRPFTGVIPPQAESLHWLYGFDPGADFFYYDMTAFTELADDEDRSNDTMRRRFYWSYAEISDTAEFVDYVRPRLDGIIERGEYGGYDQDISDFVGRAGTPRPRASCIAAGGFSFDTVYLGVNVRALHDRQDGDRLVFYVDDDGDGRWNPDSSEGMYEVRVRGGDDSVYWRPVPGGNPTLAEGCYAISSTRGGTLQFEAALANIGLVRYWWSTAALSFWRGESCWGWWPARLPLAQWEDPSQYGVIEWMSMAVQESNQPQRFQPTGPTFARGELRLESTTECYALLSCCLLDASGRKVMDLVPGPNDVSRLSPGVYFVRSKPSAVSREPSAVCKVVITR